MPWHPWTFQVTGGGWAMVKAGHVVVIRSGRVLWRSTGSTYGFRRIGMIAYRDGRIAFSVCDGQGDPLRLYVAALGGQERRVSGAEDPIEWTSSGNLVAAVPDRARNTYTVITRASDGSSRILVRSPAQYAIAAGAGTITFLTASGLLERSDGQHTARLADLRSLGLRQKSVSLSLLGDGRIALTDFMRIVILRRDGALDLAATFPSPRGKSLRTGYVGSILADPVTRGVDVLVTWWNSSSTSPSRDWPGWEGIYSLTAWSSPRLLFGRTLAMAPCAHGSTIARQGTWLLYETTEGRTVAIDTSGEHPSIDLSSLPSRLPHPWRARRFPLLRATWA
jgi:hypothetical protein